jgi:hypothetical protein
VSWTPPTDDPAHVNAQSYAVKLMPYITKVAPSFDPGSQDAYGWYSYWPLTLFAAGWKITGDAAYVRRASLAMSRVRSALAKETHAPELEVKLINKYWHGGEASAMLTAIRAFETRPEHAQLLRELGNAFVDHFEALPLYWETGAGNREWQAAFLYDMALTYGRPTPRRAEFKKYADEIWNFWFPFRDSDEDSENYSLLDLAILLEWPALRGLHWESDSKLIDLWRHYAGLITNDGTYVSYGDAGTNGDYMFAVRVAEVAARASKSGQYKWLAHRAFWNGRDRMTLLEKDWYEQQRLHLALAYLAADETVKEVPIEPSTTVTYRQFRELADYRKNQGCGPLPAPPCKPHLYLHPNKQPSKVVFRAGARERDATLVLQAGNRAGHGHPDAGAVIHYSGNFSTYLCNGVSRLDYDLEQHNLVVLQDPARVNPWQEHRFTSEQTSVPVPAQLEDSGYARLTIGPYPGVTPDEIAASWPKIRAATTKDDLEYRHAIGYKNWPVVMDRAVLLIGGMGAVVRDIVTFRLAVDARVGQNWVIGDIVAGDPAGSWIIHHVPTMSNYQYVNSTIKAPIETGPENLLIWMHTSDGAPIQTLRLRCPDDLTYHQNLTHRAWRPVTSNWAAGSSQTMTSVLIPLNPTITTPEAIPTITVDPSGKLIVRMGSGLSYRTFLGSPSGQFTFDSTTVTGEAAVVVDKTGQPARLYGWQVTHLVVGSNVLWAGPKPTNGIWVLH